MPQTEDDIKNTHTSDSPAKIVAWWQKSHFSGRVIMCSVLFGLGLILIGGLIFAINVDDSTNKNGQDDESSAELPTKAPSNYVGPVVMGIGGFISIVGVIMCLFETQVCRKKSSDTKPLITDKNDDVESKISETSGMPSSSHCHKNHKHKNRKVSSSPRKTKTKRLNHSREQKQAASKSPPISIDKSKNFMTSSEENFLTPPNTLNEHAPIEQKSSREAEIQTSSSLMKSFTSSGTWNQSSEFLTPTASYKGNSVSLDNSVELDEKQGQLNFENNEIAATVYSTRPEYMTPLTAEEEKIQKMLNEVKNEQQKIEKEQLEDNAINLSSAYEKSSSVTKSENENNEKVENIEISCNDKPLDIKFDTLSVKDTSSKSSVAILDAFEESKIVNEENNFSDSLSSASNVPQHEVITTENKTKFESTNLSEQTNGNKNEKDGEKHILSSHDSTNKISYSPDSSVSHPKEVNDVPNLSSAPFVKSMNENIHQVDLESNASSEETLISLDNSIEKPKNNEGQILLSVTEENSSIKCQKDEDLESPRENQSSFSHCINDGQNLVTGISKSEKVGASDLINVENDSKEINNPDEQATKKSS